MHVSFARTEKGWLALIGPESEGVRAGEPVEAIVLRREKVVLSGQPFAER